MKKFIEEITDKKSKNIILIKRFFYDSSKDNPIIIEQIEKAGEDEKKISEMRIPLENAPEKIKEIVTNLMRE